MAEKYGKTDLKGGLPAIFERNSRFDRGINCNKQSGPTFGYRFSLAVYDYYQSFKNYVIFPDCYGEHGANVRHGSKNDLFLGKSALLTGSGQQEFEVDEYEVYHITKEP